MSSSFPSSSSMNNYKSSSSSSSSSWTCSRCTFINLPSQNSSLCQICLSPSSVSSPLSSHSWACKSCTFLNNSARSKCEMCGSISSVSNSESSLINITCDDSNDCIITSSSSFSRIHDLGAVSDEDLEQVGSVFLPLRPCKHSLISDSDRAPSPLSKKPTPSRSTVTSSASCVKTTFKILSYNVWFREDLEVNKRMKAIGDLIWQHSPDIICFQEVTPNIYEILRQSNWWKEYCCSILKEMEFPGSYFCIQLSKLPVKAFSSKPFINSVMGRELCIADIDVGVPKKLVIATSHLESPCPAPPTWDQMFSKERVDQAKQVIKSLSDSPNAIFCGDMNWDDKLDGSFPLSEGWVDAWVELKPNEDGLTYDTKANMMLSANRPLRKRLDRFLCKLHDFKLCGIEMIGMEPIPGLSYKKEKRVKKELQTVMLPVLPSDHFGLLLTIQSL